MKMEKQLSEKLIIAIDGFSACGKSTLAKDLAKELAYVFIDSGAMYRAITLFAIQNNIAFENIDQHFNKINIHFELIDGFNTIFLNGKNVRYDIRSKEVNEAVSLVAKITSVRRFLVKLQQSYGKDKGIVMDGRDIGTVVFPNAELKFFITADIAVRTERRALEMAEIGKSLDAALIRKNLLERDHIDSTRADSPLTQADDAILLNNSELNKLEQLDLCLQYVENHFQKSK